jgi:hypothetical protein
MKAILTGCVVVCVAIAGVPAAHANDEEEMAQIPSCGMVSIDHQLWQRARGSAYVEGFAQSRRNADGCLISMRVEAWVEGIVMPTAINENYGPAVSVYFATPVPRWGTWNSLSKHWSITAFVFWQWDGYGHGSAEVAPPSTVSECTPDEPCLAASGGGTPDSPSPILVDVDGDGYELTSAEDGVLFDIDADGVLDRVAWTVAGKDDAWLAMDRNGNGRIDDGSELFGNFTPAYPNQRQQLSKNGFEALRFLEDPDYGPSYADRVIDARDRIFGRLLLWCDRNHNGISEPDELTSLAAAGVASISTDYKLSQRRDRFGNLFRQRAISIVIGRGQPVPRYVYDVWLTVLR